MRDRRRQAPLPARSPQDKAKAADITDWTALTPDDFFTALRAACQAGAVPATVVRETERRLAGGVLQARELHQILLVAGRSDGWAPARQAALAALAERPDMAVTVVHLESQRLGAPAAFEESAGGAGFTARITLTVDGQPVTGQPGQGVSKKTARQFAALSLVAMLADLPDPVRQLPDTAPADSGPRLSARELHDLLLVADLAAPAADRKIAWEQLARSPQLAGGVLSLYTQSRGQAPVRYVTITDGVVVAVLPHHDWIQEGSHVSPPGRAATTKAARAAAALALLADLMSPLADETDVTAPARHPLTELNERAQLGIVTDLAFTVTASGPPHDPVFTCSASCRHAHGEITGTGQARTKSQARIAAADALLAELTGPADPAPPSPVLAVARYATSPAGVADRLLQAGCAIRYARGQFHLGLPDGWPLPVELPDLPVPAADLLPVLARLPAQETHRSVRPWTELATTILAAVARREVYPAVDAAGCDRWAVVLPGGVYGNGDGDAEEAREFTDLAAEYLLRPPGAALIAGPVPYAARPAPLPGEVADWADQCAQLADPAPGRPLTVRLHLQDEAITAELLPRDLGHAELRGARRARSVWPPLGDLTRGPARLAGGAVAALAGEAGRGLASLGIRIEWPEHVARGLVARAVLRPSAAGAVSARSSVAVRWELWLGDAELTEEESAAVARAEGLIRMRGQWVVVDLASRERARDPDLPAITGAQAIGAALTGQIQIGGDTLDCAATGRLADLAARSRGLPSGEPRPGEAVTISGLGASLRGYQQRAVTWLADITGLGFGAVLADDMGLGKTLTVIAFHLYRPAGPTLVVCPASLLTNWEREIARFAPGVPVRRHHGTARDLDGLPAGGIVLTSYGTLLRDIGQFREVRFGLAVADEAQYIKNPRSMQAVALRHLNAEHRVAVTGTPVENSLTDLWAILDWANPGLFGTAKDFLATANKDNLNRLVGPFLLRRRKTDPAIAAELPGKIVSDHLAALTPEQTALYTAVTRGTIGTIRASRGIQRRGLILRMLQALRQVCNSPAHYLRERPDGWDPDAEAARSGKLAVLDDLLKVIAERGEASLIFTSYVSMAHLLAAHLGARGVRADIVRGGIPAARRQEIVDRFQSGDGQCLILSIRAAGVGLNLTRAGHVIHFDRHWNPAVEDQATDRAHRIGRHDTVHVHHLIAEDTVEDHIGELLRHKRAIADRLLTEDGISLTELTDEELGQLVSLGQGGKP